MLRFFYNPKYKYTNRTLIDVSSDTNFVDKDYANIDSPDTINGHIIYTLTTGENIPTYVIDLENNRRYFVSGITQLRTGKFQISLLRDILSENNLWKEEEAYIIAGNSTDFNKYKTWNLPFTNTKIKEQKLEVNGKSSFFVFYVNTQKISSGNLTEENLIINSTLLPGISQYDFEVASLAEIPSYELINAGDVYQYLNDKATINTLMYSRAPINQNDYYIWNYLDENISLKEVINGTSPVSIRNAQIPADGKGVEENVGNSKSNFATAVKNFVNTLKSSIGYVVNSSNIEDLAPYVDKIIYNSTTQKVYRLKKTESNETLNLIPDSISTLNSALSNISWPSVPDKFNKGFSFDNEYFKLTSDVNKYNYRLEELGTALNCDFNFIAAQRKLPKSAVRCVNIVSNDLINDEELSQTLMILQANTLNLNNDTGRILDIQYLPFSIANELNSNIKVNGSPMIAKFLDTDDFEFSTKLDNLTNINKETDTIKIVSPSRASQFLFKPFNNDGLMEFSTKITLKPFSTIIYVRPSTRGLLIRDWDDKDCLTISEDFSLTQVSSEWANYVYQNRNYQNAFEREIQGREFNRDWERKIEQAQAKADEWTSRNISSQKARTYTGNLPIISDIAGAIGTSFKDNTYMQMAQLDREYNEALYQESLSISKDLFSYQLDNIKSQPTIPSKVTTIDVKFLDGIYLEFYSTNETELLAINNFYKYNGNRIDCYGTFSKYYGWFIRGKIIKSLNYTQPEMDEINRRLNAGIFTEVIYVN